MAANQVVLYFESQEDICFSLWLRVPSCRPKGRPQQ